LLNVDLPSFLSLTNEVEADIYMFTSLVMYRVPDEINGGLVVAHYVDWAFPSGYDVFHKSPKPYAFSCCFGRSDKFGLSC
jgi:hypothetical protein